MSQTELTLDEALEVAARAHRAGDLSVAEALYGRILEAVPGHVGALHLYGLLEHGRGRHRQALRLIRQAVEQAPAEAGLHSDLGNVLLELDRPDLAIQAYEEAIRLDPGAVAARNNLGVVLRALRLPEAAEAVYREVIAMDPAHRDAWDNLGRLLAGSGRITEAIACHARALELEPANAATRRHLVAAFAATGERDKALPILQAWLRDEPESPAARHLLAAISGENVPDRASDAYVANLFDAFAATFDHKLARLDYRAPDLVVEAVVASQAAGTTGLAILDAGCGTGLCGPLLRPFAGRLTGVDLSRKMLDRAAERGCYDALEEAELTAFLTAHPSAYDLIVSADTLCYFGRLDAVFRASAAALKPGGRLIFTVEETGDEASAADSFTLHGHGRYSHALTYLEEALGEAEFVQPNFQRSPLRMERGEPVVGLVITAHIPGCYDGGSAAWRSL